MINCLLLPDFTKTKTVECISSGNKINSHLLYYRYLNGTNNDKRFKILKEKFIPHVDTSMLSCLQKRYEKSLEQIKGRKYTVLYELLKLVDRMVMGMGISSSFENGLLLHWIHGIPYINGEALKGAARSYARERLNEKDANQKEEFRRMFGTFEKGDIDSRNISRGEVMFFDAFPVNRDANNLFDIDVVTCHHNGYYTEDIPREPGDWESPVPVPFLTMRAGIQFKFAVASKDKNLAERAWEYLKNALILRGTGAKKRVGYGHFSPIV